MVVVVVVVDIVVVVVVIVFVVVSWVDQWRRRCRRRRRRSTVGVEVSAGRSLESAPGCLFLPFRLTPQFRPSARESRPSFRRRPFNGDDVALPAVADAIRRFCTTPIIPCLFSTATLSIYSTTMCLDNETLLFQKISRSSLHFNPLPRKAHCQCEKHRTPSSSNATHGCCVLSRAARVKHAFNSLLNLAWISRVTRIRAIEDLQQQEGNI